MNDRTVLAIYGDYTPGTFNPNPTQSYLYAMDEDLNPIAPQTTLSSSTFSTYLYHTNVNYNPLRDEIILSSYAFDMADFNGDVDKRIYQSLLTFDKNSGQFTLKQTYAADADYQGFAAVFVYNLYHAGFLYLEDQIVFSSQFRYSGANINVLTSVDPTFE